MNKYKRVKGAIYLTIALLGSTGGYTAYSAVTTSPVPLTEYLEIQADLARVRQQLDYPAFSPRDITNTPYIDIEEAKALVRQERTLERTIQQLERELQDPEVRSEVRKWHAKNWAGATGIVGAVLLSITTGTLSLVERYGLSKS